MQKYKIDNNDRNVYPMGLTRLNGGIHISVAAVAETCSLLMFLSKNGRIAKNASPMRIPFPQEGRIGDVWEMTVLGDDLDRYYYALEADGKAFADPYGQQFAGREKWADPEQADVLLKAPVRCQEFDWEDDRLPAIPYEDCVVYRVHVRGFTMHRSSGASERGTFGAVAEKIPYLKELGVTTLELMPVAEFQELFLREPDEADQEGKLVPSGKINYWGYASACGCAPKAAYAGKKKDPVLELKQLVKALHKAGMELVVEMYFTDKDPAGYVLETVRHWVREYHLDGVHLTGHVPLELLAQDPYLSRTKLWANSWGQAADGEKKRKRLGQYNDDFLIDMRRTLKGDEDQMSRLAYHVRRNPGKFGVLNYMANTNGFTMMDMVSYNEKHNEANGEDNQDGTVHNHSWNCGVEGPINNKKYQELRRRQLRNAMLLLFLSQGTPLLLSGDEFGNSQAGNNNAYCQDNDISWLNWNLLKTNKLIYDFARHAIAFRKAHPVFHMSAEPQGADYLVCGLPDVSCHGLEAWRPQFDTFRRQMAFLYCGDYAVKPDGTKDSHFYVIYNMHWSSFEFALPSLPPNMRWHMVFDTGNVQQNGYFEPGTEPELEDQKKLVAEYRSIIVLMSVEHGSEEESRLTDELAEKQPEMPEQKPTEKGRRARKAKQKPAVTAEEENPQPQENAYADI